MKKPKEALEDLWNDGFFLKRRKTKEIKEKVFADYHCTYSNWAVLLRSIKFLRKEGKVWVQRTDPAKAGDVTIIQIEANKPRTATKSFEDVAKEFTEEVLVSDPYLTKDCLDLLEKIKCKKLKFLFHVKDKRLSDREVSDFKTENSHVELKIFDKPYLHDRYVIGSDKILLIGHGLSLRNKETFMILLKNSMAQDLVSSLTETFNRRWKEASNI